MKYCNFILDNWLTLVSLLLALIGSGFALFQWKKAVQVRRAEFVHQIIERLRFNDELVKAMYNIDYEQNWYYSGFHNSELEASIDKLFSYLDYICYLRSNNIISKKEFAIFQYKINRVCVSISTKEYLWNLYHFSKKNNADCSFQFLLNYGIQYEIFPKDFRDNETLYNKTLNW